jgi:hypothetical protein
MATDNHTRSLVKAISWRITGTVDTILISWLTPREFKFALSTVLVELFTKNFSTTATNGCGTVSPSGG